MEKQSLSMQAILIGYSGHAFVVADALIQSGHHLAGYFDREEKTLNPFDIPWLGIESDPDLAKRIGDAGLIVAIGDNRMRGRIDERLFADDFSMLTVIHPAAIVAHSARISEGTVVMAGAVINPMAYIGRGAIINTHSTVEHECRIGHYAHVAPGAVLAGNVSLGDYAFVGAGAVVKQGVHIGAGATVGAGAVVLKNVKPGAVVAGNPAKVIRR